jgi:ABC-type bacteriocin/lantibiotic exporter with double-glycine peptidase domain
MVLAYYGIQVSERELCDRCNHSYEAGCTSENMKQAFEYYGLSAKIKNNSSLDDVKYYLNRRIPVIVDWFTPGVNPKPSDMPDGHSGIIVGLDDHVHLLDPENAETRRIVPKDFLRVWFDWKTGPYLEYPEQLLLRSMLVAYPNNLQDA